MGPDLNRAFVAVVTIGIGVGLGIALGLPLFWRALLKPFLVWLVL